MGEYKPGNIKRENTKTPENKIKEGVDFVFEQNPELMNVACDALNLVDFSMPDNSGYITLYRAEGEIVDREELSDFNKQSAGTWFSPKKEEALRYASAIKGRKVYKVNIPNSYYVGLNESAKDSVQMSKGEVRLPIDIAEKKELLTNENENDIDKNPYKIKAALIL